MIESEEEKANRLIVIGGLWAILNAADAVTDVLLYDTESLQVRLSFMRSAYRVTVERITDGGDDHD